MGNEVRKEVGRGQTHRACRPCKDLGFYCGKKQDAIGELCAESHDLNFKRIVLFLITLYLGQAI